MVKLDLKGSIDHGFGHGAFSVAPLGGIWVRPAHLPLNPPPGLPAIVHHLLGLAKCVQLWGFQRFVAAQLSVHQALEVVCPPIEAGKHGRGLNG